MSADAPPPGPTAAPSPVPAEEAEEAEDYDRLLYARGYLVGTMPSPWVPAGWVRRRFGGWTVWHDPRLAFAAASAPRRVLGGAVEVACLGVVLDADRPEDGPDAVLTRLAEALRRSEDAMLRALDTVAGRHVLLYRVGGRTHVVTDAAGTKQVHRYARETTLVSSHAKLIARNAREAEAVSRLTFKFGYPGLDTGWRHLHLLTPNTRLRLEDGEVRRFWPRQRLRPVGVPAASEEVARLIENALRHLASRFDLHLSITAGLDSRLTLALARDLPAELFTFYRDDAVADDGLDRAFARDLRRGAGRKVRVLRLREMRMPRAFVDALDRTTVKPHVRVLAWAFLKRFSQDERAMHLRSNVSEVGRQFYGRPLWSSPPRGRDLARLYFRRRRGVPVAEVFDAITRFERFADTTGILGCAGMADLGSLFYWEHRMPSWLGNVLAESDVGIDTVSPYNCRRVLELMLSVPESHQANSSVHRHIVATRAPELTRYPVNGEVLWP